MVENIIKPDKVIKKEFKIEASKNPDKYYATTILKKEGFMRKKCSNCGTYFWTVNKKQEVCGDAECSGGFRLFEKNPCKKKMSYIEVWKEFSKMFEKKGYDVIKRYPVVARWNPTMNFTIASIAAFQPYVINGEVDPPAKRLVIPQFCLRFGDIDNVGITMSHFTGFIMIGQHIFVPPNEWDQDKAFKDIYDWLIEGLGLPKEEITFHEDAWAGGGNFGPCMEFFSRGIELGNQVYMMFEQRPEGPRELSLKVLDMGMGHERNAWFSQGEGTIYDATFPEVINKLKDITGVVYDKKFMEEYIQKAAFLNIDEVDDIQKAWNKVASELKISVDELRKKIESISAIYSIAEHSRSLLFAISDGGLPSNVGGGYNLRTIFRRAQEFIDRFNWKINIGDVCEYHAEYLKELFPELKNNISEIKKILDVEKRKYYDNKKKAEKIISKVLNEGIENNIDKMVMLYDSNGISPDQIISEGKKIGKKINFPDKFYQLVNKLHEQKENKNATKKKSFYPVSELPKTKVLYYDDYKLDSFKGKVLKIIDKRLVVLDKTIFYPTSGGQEHDTGSINNISVIDVIKQDGVIIHIFDKDVNFNINDEVFGKIDIDRRLQLTQHHTATHIINGAARKVLGNHIWQAGASKSVDKARIDITHYEKLSDKELKMIEEEANNIIKKEINIKKDIEPKNVAEKDYGFRLYQGGAVPGSKIRVVNIPGFDVEACGGTHLNNTKEVGMIKILRSNKVQDGIVRIEFVAGKSAQKIIKAETDIIIMIMKELECDQDKIPGRALELFNKWKKAKKGKLSIDNIKLTSIDNYDGDVLIKSAEILKTQPEHVLKTIKRFKKEILERIKK